jgi:uncharacterized cupin superfamily protein
VGYRVADASDMELWQGAMRRVRRELGIRSFGINQVEVPPGWDNYPEHDETETNHEELYLCLAGGGVVVVDGDEIEWRPGRYVLVEPESRRRIRAGSQGLTYVVIGAPADRDRGGWDDL